MSFRGSSPAKLDDRGRLKIPATFRGEFQAAADVFVTRRGGPQVLLYPMKTFEEQIEDRLDTQAGLDAAASAVLRQLNANGMSGQVDAQGRVTLSQDLRVRAGFAPGEELRLIGMKDHIEVWREEAYRQFEEDQNGI